MATVSWNPIISSAGVCTMRKFVSGELSGKKFGKTSSEARRVVDSLGVTDARSRARKALYRYENRTAVDVA